MQSSVLGLKAALLGHSPLKLIMSEICTRVVEFLNISNIDVNSMNCSLEGATSAGW